MKVLLFAGAGTSVELGIPAMRRMLEEFQLHLNDLRLSHEVIGALSIAVRDETRDMEYVIDLIDKVEAGERAKAELGETTDETKLLTYRAIRGEAEWYVQHSCEQINVSAAVQAWMPSLRIASYDQELSFGIGTTNYDRAIEIAASRSNILLDDGFEEFLGREYSPWQGKWGLENTALYKLHGSTDWYRGEDDQIIKLRHPMPLFGGVRVQPKTS